MVPRRSNTVLPLVPCREKQAALTLAAAKAEGQRLAQEAAQRAAAQAAQAAKDKADRERTAAEAKRGEQDRCAWGGGGSARLLGRRGRCPAAREAEAQVCCASAQAALASLARTD